ncbi:hypothetical protein Taro_006864 [Colocasia esculenta]|uniref:CCHC-type domain-containing protein n=1 Tax=Colocasia esculenta TaxID=4460 RepID=A0A843U223_COLES|nr:hypothetical protein [Colocasia esculenta]
MARNQWQVMQETVARLTQAPQNVVQDGNQAATARNGAGDLHRNFRSLNPPRFSGSPDPDEAENWQEEIEWIFQERKAAEFAALKQKGISVTEYEAQFARLAVYAPHLVGTERLKANRFMDGLRPTLIERLGPHNIQTYTEMVQRAQLVEDTIAKVEGMRGKDNSKPVFVKKGAPNIAPTFRNTNVNNNNKRPNGRRDVVGDKKVKVEGRQLTENCKFCDKLGHRTEECWKKLGACLRCGGRDHRIPDCPMMKDQPGKAQNVPRCQGCLNAVVEVDLLEEGGMELLVAEELWNDHKKHIFFPVASAATCTDSHLEVDQRITLCRSRESLVCNPKHCPFFVGFRRRPYERDGPIGRVLSLVATAHPSHSERDEHTVATSLPDLTAPSRSSHPLFVFFSRPVATLTGGRRDLTFGSDCPVAFFICTRRDLRILH